LITHVAPDGDAIGSTLGLAMLLREQNKDVTLACQDPVPDTYAWLPGIAGIVREGAGPYDLLVSLDCSDVRRMGSVFRQEFAGVPLLNIDHHVTNTRFGTVDWVSPASVATAQMILELAEALDWPLTADLAACLLTGLVTDTRSFRTYNVDTEAMRAVLRLMEAGAELNEITRRALDQRPLASVRLWGQAIDRLDTDGEILWTEVTRSMRERWGLDENGDAGLANFLSGVRDSKIVVVFTERDDGTIDVGMRSVPGYDVATVALALGGGGHPQAAGCTLEGDLADVEERVLAAVGQNLAGARAGKS
jgi:phosphoesterase RecJ-like protein